MNINEDWNFVTGNPCGVAHLPFALLVWSCLTKIDTDASHLWPVCNIGIILCIVLYIILYIILCIILCIILSIDRRWLWANLTYWNELLHGSGIKIDFSTTWKFNHRNLFGRATLHLLRLYSILNHLQPMRNAASGLEICYGSIFLLLCLQSFTQSLQFRFMESYCLFSFSSSHFHCDWNRVLRMPMIHFYFSDPFLYSHNFNKFCYTLANTLFESIVFIGWISSNEQSVSLWMFCSWWPFWCDYRGGHVVLVFCFEIQLFRLHITASSTHLL